LWISELKEYGWSEIERDNWILKAKHYQFGDQTK
jgi:hypothetical protein